MIYLNELREFQDFHTARFHPSIKKTYFKKMKFHLTTAPESGNILHFHQN